MTALFGTRDRLASLDALRGFDMFWVMGGEEVFHRMEETSASPFWAALSAQFRHADWHGFTAYDLVFPLFLFLAGVATPYSIGRHLEAGRDRRVLLSRVIRRAVILVLLGVFYNSWRETWLPWDMRFPSVLGRIGLAWLGASAIYLYSDGRRRLVWLLALLAGYWLLLALGSAPGHPRGDLSLEGNVVSYLDSMIMPGKLLLSIHDPEGLIGTIPAIATALLGIHAGTLLRATPEGSEGRTTVRLLLTAVFHYVIDVLGCRRWAFFFTVIGANAIVAYMSPRFVDWLGVSFRLSSRFVPVGGPYTPVLSVFGALAVQWLCLYVLYRRKIFLRV